MYLLDKIGKDYESWKPGDVILITAPTGTGKSYFIQREYLKWMIKERKGKILYLVNRKILRKQMITELQDTLYEIQQELRCAGVFVLDLNDYIRYETYQKIEKYIVQKNEIELQKFITEFSCVIYDECHYFAADSTFNPRTEMSYNFLRQAFDDKVQIYMSATMDVVKDKIKSDCLQRELLPKRKGNLYIPFRIKQVGNIKEDYDLEQNYDYVTTHLLDKMEALVSEIETNTMKTGEKWLVFTDSIEKGKSLKQSLCRGKKENDPLADNKVVVINARYSEDEEAEEFVEQLTEGSLLGKSVIITTPVMDNGISIYDENLKNIVIMTDMKASFIQMLGRKRKRNRYNTIELYLFKQDSTHFLNRWKYVQNILNEHNKLKQHFQEERNCIVQQRNLIEFVPLPEYREAPYINHDNEIEFGVKYNPGVYDVPFGQEYIVGDKAIMCFRSQKWNKVIEKNSIMLDKLMVEPQYYANLRRICFIQDSMLWVNEFALEQFKEQASFYYRMYKSLENDEYAFYKEQCAWLGKYKVLDDIIEEAKSTRDKRVEMLCDILQGKVGVEMNVEENEAFKDESYREVLKQLIEEAKSYDETLKDVKMDPLKKAGTNITEKQFNTYMEILGLPFRLIVLQSRPKKIVRIDRM